MNNDELTALIVQLRDQQLQANRKLDELQLSKKPGKDKWDKASVITSFISGVLIALVGGAFTLLYHKQDSDMKTRQIEVNKVDLVSKFMPYLVESGASDQDHLRNRIHAIRMFDILHDRDLSFKIAQEFSSVETLAALNQILHPNDNSFGKDIAEVKVDRPSESSTDSDLSSGQTVLYDGFQNYKISAFSFATLRIWPWGTRQVDIAVANPDPLHSDAIFFVNNDSPPYIPANAGGITAHAGIIKMPEQNLQDVKEAPNGEYAFHYFKPEILAVYCIRTWDEKHWAKIQIISLTKDRIEFKWVYNKSGTRKLS
jgi:hypothetical protein